MRCEQTHEAGSSEPRPEDHNRRSTRPATRLIECRPNTRRRSGPSFQEKRGSCMDLTTLPSILKRWSWLILAVTVVATVAVHLALSTAPPVYTAQARIQVTA